MGISVSSLFYKEKPKKNAIKEEQAVKRIFKKHLGIFGRRSLRKELQKEGLDISEYKISKIMKKYGLVSKYGRRKGTNVNTSKETEKYIQENIFSQLNQNERKSLDIWSMDFSEIKLKKKKYYLCGIISVNTKICIAVSISNIQTKETAIECIKEGLSKYRKPDMITTDRGTQFVSKTFYEYLSSEGIIHSMSRPHKPVDNCYIETFWKTLKTEIGKIDDYDVTTFEMILKYYVHYYNYERPHSSIKYETPIKA